jgi:hypothetical protein
VKIIPKQSQSLENQVVIRWIDGVQSVEKGFSYRRSDDVGPPQDDDAGGFLQHSASDSLVEIDVVKSVTEPFDFIVDLEMKLLDSNALRPGQVASLSQVAG